MQLPATEEQRRVQETVCRFAREEIAPRVPEMDRTGKFAEELHPRFTELGLFGLLQPEQHGGAGLDHLTLGLVQVEIATVSVAMAMYLQSQEVLTYQLSRLGTEEQKTAYVVPVVRGEKLGCFAFTEPDTGSDANALKTRAVVDGDEYVIDGQKRFITNAPRAAFGIIFAKDWEDDVSLFIVEADRPGWSVSEPWEKMGHRGVDLADIYLDSVHIPRTNLLGGQGGKFRDLRRAMTLGKFCLSAQCVGIMQAALEAATAYADTRVVRGQRLAKMMSIRALLAEIATRLEASRQLVYDLGQLLDEGKDTIKEAAITKLFASQAAIDVTRMALQVHGSYGYMRDYPIERLYRDARGYELFEGVSEIQREIIVSLLEREYYGQPAAPEPR